MRRLLALLVLAAAGGLALVPGDAAATLRKPCPQSAPYASVVSGTAYCATRLGIDHRLRTRSTGLH